MGEWIKTSDRLPEVNEEGRARVLLFFASANLVTSGDYWSRGWWEPDEREMIIHEDAPSHWMPLPAPPVSNG